MATSYEVDVVVHTSGRRAREALAAEIAARVPEGRCEPMTSTVTSAAAAGTSQHASLLVVLAAVEDDASLAEHWARTIVLDAAQAASAPPVGELDVTVRSSS